MKVRSCNERIHVLQMKREQLAQKESERPVFENKKHEYEAAVKATNILPLYDAHGTTLKELTDTAEKLEMYEVQLKQLEVQLAQANDYLKAEQAREPERTKCINDVNELEKIKPVYEEIDKLTKKIPVLQRNVDQLTQEMTDVQALYNKQKEALALQGELVEKIEQQVSLLPEKLKQEQQLKDVTNAFLKLNKARGQTVLLQTDVEKATAQYEEANRLYEEQEQKWIHNRAYELALTLVPGSACPVCGSTEHPNLQTNEAGAVDKSVLQQAKTAVASAQQHQSMIHGKLEAATLQLQEYQQELIAVRC